MTNLNENPRGIYAFMIPRNSKDLGCIGGYAVGKRVYLGVFNTGIKASAGVGEPMSFSRIVTILQGS